MRYPTTKLTVPDEYVDLSPENTDRALREQKELDAIHGTITREMLWKDPFVVPIAGETGTNSDIAGCLTGRHALHMPVRIFIAATGTPVHSTNRGRVVLAKELFFTGNTIVVDHGLGIYSLYAHLSRIDVEVVRSSIEIRCSDFWGDRARDRTSPSLGNQGQNARVDPFSLINFGKP